MKKHIALAAVLITISSGNLFARGKHDVPPVSDTDTAALEAVLPEDTPDDVPYLSDPDMAALEAVLPEDVPDHTPATTPAAPVAAPNLSDENMASWEIVLPEDVPDHTQAAAPTAASAANAKTPPEMILSEGGMSRQKMVGFLLAHNRTLGKRRDWVNNLIDIYIAEAGREGVNYEIAFAQMCYHTNYLKFEKTFAGAGTNNFCGIRSSASSKKAHAFDSAQIGVKAHIQHLKGYASEEPLKGSRVDPRYQNIEKGSGFGSAPTIDGLSGKWAGADYAEEIRMILNVLYNWIE
jgi:hypothetical protein